MLTVMLRAPSSPSVWIIPSSETLRPYVTLTVKCNNFINANLQDLPASLPWLVCRQSIDCFHTSLQNSSTSLLLLSLKTIQGFIRGLFALAIFTRTWYSVFHKVVSELPFTMRSHNCSSVGNRHEDVSWAKTRESFTLLNLRSVFVDVSILNQQTLTIWCEVFIFCWAYSYWNSKCYKFSVSITSYTYDHWETYCFAKHLKTHFFDCVLSRLVCVNMEYSEINWGWGIHPFVLNTGAESKERHVWTKYLEAFRLISILFKPSHLYPLKKCYAYNMYSSTYIDRRDGIKSAKCFSR